MVWASRIMAGRKRACRARRRRCLRSVAWVKALIGLKLRLPQTLSQISERMSLETGALNPAALNAFADCSHRRSVAAVDLAQAESVALDDLDHAGPDDLAGWVDHAADHTVHVDVPRDAAVRVDSLHGCLAMGPGSL